MEPAPEERDDACLSQSRGPLISQPQWSPLRRSGTTIAALRSTPPGHEAAMEPAPEERDDLFTAGASGSRGLGRNGARSGGAGRPRPRVLRRSPLAAAMEPAPEERDDLGELALAARRTRCCAAAMEPAPEERDDGSQKTSLLTCMNAIGRERYRADDTVSFHCGVVKMQIRPLTWARALPGGWLSTGALARSDDDRT